MDKPVDHYWMKRLNDLKEALEKNWFKAYVAGSVEDARNILEKEIVNKIKPKSVSFGGSMTFRATGLYDALKKRKGLKVVDTMDKTVGPGERMKRLKKALQVDLFFTGTNAITEIGQLVNLDRIGNRVAGITFGPEHVVVCIGRNKVVADLEPAMERIKDYAAPVNAMRLDKKTPCVKTSHCAECNSPERTCNTWTITEKSFPKGRTRVVLINQDLGL